MENKKQVALIEFRNFHDEVLPSVARAFLESGCGVDVFLTSVNLRKNAFKHVPRTSALRFYSIGLATRLLFQLRYFDAYSLVVINTVEGVNILRYTRKIKSPLMLSLHNADAAFEGPIQEVRTKRSARCLVFAPQVAQYLRERAVESKCVLPVYFGSLPDLKRSANIFIVQGNFVPQKRNYAALLQAVVELKDRLPKNFVVRLVGRSGSTEARRFRDVIRKSGMEKRLSFRNTRAISFPKFFEELSSATFIIPLIDRSNEQFNEYYTTTLSSSISVGLGMGLIPIIEESYAEVYGMSEFSITYRTGALAIALEKALSLDDDEVRIRREGLRQRWSRAVEDGYHEIEKVCGEIRETAQKRRGIYFALRSVNVIFFLVVCTLVGLVFKFNPIAIVLVALIEWLAVRFAYDLLDVWRYYIKKPLAHIKRMLFAFIPTRR